MKVGIFLGVYNHISLDEALQDASKRGYQAVEIAVDRAHGQIDIDEILQGDNAKKLKQKIESYGLMISALSNHAEGQLVLGPHHHDTDHIYQGSPEEKIAYGIKRIKKTAQAAAALEVPVVCGFCGCEDYSRWFPWPNERGWEEMAETFVTRWNGILDTFAEYGIKFAHECHPKEYAYNIETAELTMSLLNDRQEWGFNFDPANLLLAGVDPVVFIQVLGKRIYHVHAKDGEIVKHNISRSGLLAHGSWARIDRGFRFRIPGWGDIPWKRIITELRLIDYDYVLTVEHEDATMSREDGIRKAIDYLRPLIINKPFEGQRWW
ncbi:MAG: sugar phosphate isomerase/epimerase [bacterium]|nr:sugar phosphate isomerase/epimerase [bacterium]